MVAIIDSKLSELENLCRKHRVRRLEVFGSAADGTFDPSHSDIDFLVEFERLEPPKLADVYFGLRADLERTFQRKIDLLTPNAIRNPFVLRRVNESRKLVFDAGKENQE